MKSEMQNRANLEVWEATSYCCCHLRRSMLVSAILMFILGILTLFLLYSNDWTAILTGVLYLFASMTAAIAVQKRQTSHCLVFVAVTHFLLIVTLIEIKIATTTYAAIMRESISMDPYILSYFVLNFIFIPFDIWCLVVSVKYEKYLWVKRNAHLQALPVRRDTEPILVTAVQRSDVHSLPIVTKLCPANC